MLVTWLSENKTKDWVTGLNFVQHMKNTSLHKGIKMTPYKAIFGIDPKVGLSTSNLPKSIVHSLETEEDLIALCESPEDNIPTEGSNSQPCNSIEADYNEISSQVLAPLSLSTTENNLISNEGAEIFKQVQADYNQISSQVLAPISLSTENQTLFPMKALKTLKI